MGAIETVHMWPLKKFEQIGATVADEQATKSAFSQSIRNIPFFLVATAFVAWLIGTFGLFGKIVGVLQGLLLVVFVLQALLSTSLGVIILIAYPFRSAEERQSAQPVWVFLGVLITAIDAIVYAACIYVIGRTAQWWN